MQVKAVQKSHELKILRKFNNPFLVGFEDSFFVELAYCIILEYCEVNSNKKIELIVAGIEPAILWTPTLK